MTTATDTVTDSRPVDYAARVAPAPATGLIEPPPAKRKRNGSASGRAAAEIRSAPQAEPHGPIAAFGVRYSLEWLPIATLAVDHEYQRQVTPRHVHRIARGFDRDIFGVLTVSERGDSTRMIVDGQHRVEALRLLDWGDAVVPCLVYRGITPAQEAKIFVDTQTTSLYMTPAARLKAALKAGDEQAEELVRIVEEHGFTVNTSAGSTGDVNAIDAVAALMMIPRQYGTDQFVATLALLRDAWQDRHKPSGGIIRGLALFTHRYEGHYLRMRLLHLLKERSPSIIDNEARDIMRGLGGVRDEAIGMVLLRHYNYKSSVNKLPEWSLAPNKKGRNA